MLLLIYERGDEETFTQGVLPLFEAESPGVAVYDAGTPLEVPEGTTVVAYLPDDAVARLLVEAASKGWRVGLLPHPRMTQGRIGFGIAASLAEAAEDITGGGGDHRVDLLTCNGEAVLSSVVIGDPFAAGPVAGESVPARLRGVIGLVRGLRSTVPHRFRIVTTKEKVLETAALGIVVVEHGGAAMLSRGVIEGSAVNDGMLHALVYAPRSVLMMLGFQLRKMLPRSRGEKRALPSFVGHIKSASVTITSPRPFGYTVNGRKGEAAELTLAIGEQSLSLVPGRNVEARNGAAPTKEVFRVTGLPSGEVLGEMKERPLPWIHHASPEEFKTLFQMLRDHARASESYMILTVLSTLLATFGLFANSAPVIIGAMILAPLMSPIVAMGMGVLRNTERSLLVGSLRSLAIGVGLAMACAVLVAWITPLRTVNDQIASRMHPTLLDMGIAVFSGIAGAYAHARAEVARSLAGVAIAVALVPPLAVAGVGVGWGDWGIFSGAALLFVTNLVGMVLAAAGTFLMLGYSPFTYSRGGMAVSIATFVAVTLLLTPGFLHMVDEHRITGELDRLVFDGVELRDVRYARGRPVRIDATLVSPDLIGMDRIEAIKAEVERVVGRPIRFEATTAIVR
jgi:uncharacterized hydrophobic protein (TIGR00271 family)